MTAYATLDQLKTPLKITDTSRDAQMTRALDTGASMIYRRTGGRVFHLDAEVSQRTFEVSGRVGPRNIIFVSDIGSSNSIVVEGSWDGVTWTVIVGASPRPFDAIVTDKPITGFWLTYPWTRWRYVRVTARWGWPAVPADIVEANLLLARRLLKRPDSPEGVFGNPEWGYSNLRRFDPDAESILSGYELVAFA